MKVIEAILGIVLKIMAFVVGLVVEAIENIKDVFKLMFETVLFFVLLVSLPVWILPYILIIKRKESGRRNNK